MKNVETKETKNHRILTGLTFGDYAEYLGRRGTVILWEEYSKTNKNGNIVCLLWPERNAYAQTNIDFADAVFCVGTAVGNSKYKYVLKHVELTDRIYEHLNARMSYWNWRELGKLKGKDEILEWVVTKYGKRIFMGVKVRMYPMPDCPNAPRSFCVCTRTAVSYKYLNLERWIAKDEKEVKVLEQKVEDAKAELNRMKERLAKERADFKAEGKKH